MRRRDKRGWYLLGVVFIAVFLFTFLNGRFKTNEEDVNAADLSKFDPGYIISDYQMGNYNSMTEAEIQAFLTKKNPCGNTNYNLYLEQTALYPNVSWHFKDGHFVCLSEELFGDGEVIGSGETAAHIIWQAAQDYKINPKVLIVLLEKEQGLITDDFPNSRQYRSATGYGCPDTAPCSEKYYGLKNQVRKAAALFREVLDGGWTNYPLGNNYIQYNPDAGCGGSVVNIKNLATSALYRYTPYQPNAGSLAAGYGTVYCGAYGNRNFYLYFEDWFGGVASEKVNADVYNLKSGEYRIIPVNNVDYSLQTENGSPVLAPSEDSMSDVFSIVNSMGDYYTITNKSIGMSLDVEGNNKSIGANILFWTTHNEENQQWMIYRNDNGTYSFASKLGPYLAMSYKDNAVYLDFYSKTDAKIQFYLVSNEEPAIDSEVYRVQSVAKSGLVLDIYGGTTPNTKSGKLSTYPIKNGSNDNQTFRFIYDKTGYYRIINTHTGLNVTTSSVDFASGTQLSMLPQNNKCGQLWTVEKNGAGEIKILSACSRKALDLNVENGDVILYAYHGDKNQRWKLASVLDEGVYTISSALSEGYYLMSNGNSKNISLKKTNTPTKFTLKYNESGNYYQIFDERGLAIDVEGNSLTNGGNIIAYPKHGGENQRWRIPRNTDGTFNIESVKSKKNVDIWENDLSIGRIIQWQKHSEGNQKWILDKVVE